ncbi:hypothetical protein FPZ24_03945 [Sphingomonas panacisoli]|uniref:Uncharacterized protein n=1 Tax=Sphingomonas panacisoli TaxID=1813879 RepID=A0A5B8LG40_9SPHN|nr:ParB N-terminal domain-containing protein [Sphingomonas panacisoli]QDZ06735.1 hypothetical protein FPZ24_03945 [Sphingomonas panacisoli]
MTARRSRTSFASLLRHASRREVEPPAPNLEGTFRVDPARVRLWSGLAAPTTEECRENVAAIAREGQTEPVTVRPVFDDALYEYEVIAGARDWVAVRHLREVATPRLDLLVRVALVDDEGAGEFTDIAPEPRYPLPDPLIAAFGGEALSDELIADLTARLDGPMAPILLATAGQIARAQDARQGDGLPPYPVGEVLRLLDVVGRVEEPPSVEVSLRIVDAAAGDVTFSLSAADELPPEMLARIVKAMIDGAAADGIAVTWAIGPSAATSP